MTTAKHKVKFSSGRKAKNVSVQKPIDSVVPTTRMPRITKMMALAIRFDHLIKTGQVKDQADLARLAHVSRARLTQIMDLLLLAPDIQEDILYGELAIAEQNLHERQIREIATLRNWKVQRKKWTSTLLEAEATVH